MQPHMKDLKIQIILHCLGPILWDFSYIKSFWYDPQKIKPEHLDIVTVRMNWNKSWVSFIIPEVWTKSVWSHSITLMLYTFSYSITFFNVCTFLPKMAEYFICTYSIFSNTCFLWFLQALSITNAYYYY